MHRGDETAGGGDAPDDGAAPDIPSWVDRLDMPVWISGPGHRIVHLNAQAEALLGRPRAECLGRACDEIVQAAASDGRRFCRPRCALTVQAQGGGVMAPATVQLDRGRGSRWLHLVVVPLELPGEADPWLVHCASPVDRAARAERYLERVAGRSADRGDGGAAPSPVAQLTRRELEILGLLAEGHAPAVVAERLHVSLVTVRNHVQRLLAKLGAHSIPEAVARYLLEAGDGGA